MELGWNAAEFRGTLDEWLDLGEQRTLKSDEDECMACLETRRDCRLLDLQCGKHSICIDCFRIAVRLAIDDESHYPISCGAGNCGTIQDYHVERYLTNDDSEDATLLAQYNAKAEEWRTHAATRIYCASQECQTAQGTSRFINPDIMGEETKVICPDCSSITCRLCRDLVLPDQDHVCREDDLDAAIKAHLESLSEDQRWLWQNCYSCRSWVVKIQACNHMTCRCSAQFCLVCGRQWPFNGASCKWGCPHFAKPIYDDEGYNQFGFHRATGLDRNGNPHDPNADLYGDLLNYDDDYDEYEHDYGYEHPVLDQEGYDQHGYDAWGRDRDGYDRDGIDVHGIDRDGFDWAGFNGEGYDREGFNRNGYDADGFNRDGFDKAGRDQNRFFDDGFDLDGFDRELVSMTGIHRDFYVDSWDPFGFSPFGFSEAGYDCDGFDPEGYNVEGYDNEGFDRDGYKEDGYDRMGFDRHGLDHERFDRRGYAHHKDRNGDIEPKYHVAPDGNLRRDVYEGPSAVFMECDHRTRFVRGGATCVVCRWTSDIFYRDCAACGRALCRDCDNAGVERQRMSIRATYPWPGSDSYGIAEMVKRAELWELDAQQVEEEEMVEFQAQVAA